MREYGIYIHVPFCRCKCRYCDFYSRPPAPGEMDRFVEAISHEATMRTSRGKAATVYFGGGTPSFIGARRLSQMITGK